MALFIVSITTILLHLSETSSLEEIHRMFWKDSRNVTKIVSSARWTVPAFSPLSCAHQCMERDGQCPAFSYDEAQGICYLDPTLTTGVGDEVHFEKLGNQAGQTIPKPGIGGWIVFQRRMDDTVNFYRGWADYVNGFGDPDGNYWLGLEALHTLTSSGNWTLRIDLEDWEGNTAYATYTGFYIPTAPTATGFGDSMDDERGMAFTTFDADHDTKPDGNCAVVHGGAWWYTSCFRANLNGEYRSNSTTPRYTGINWYHWKNYSYSLKFTEMKIKRIQ